MPSSTTKQKVVLAIAAGALLACAILVLPPARPPRGDVDGRPAIGKTDAPSRPVLLFLKGRDHIIAVHIDGGESGGPRVSVYSIDGTPLASEITGREMQRRFPLLHEFYRSSYAEAWAGSEIDLGGASRP